MRFTLLLPAILWLAVATTCCSAGGNAEQSSISQEDLWDVAALTGRLEHVSEEDRQDAERLFVQAERALAGGKYGPAFKLFGEAALRHPSDAALLGMAEALAYLPRDRPRCQDRVDAKSRDLVRAVDLIRVAMALNESMTESESVRQRSSDEAAPQPFADSVVRKLRALAERQLALSREQIGCLGE